MKRYLMLITAVTLMAVAVPRAFAKDYCQLQVTVTTSATFDVTGDPLTLSVAANSAAAVHGTPATVTNTATGPVTYRMRISGIPTGWSSTTGAAAHDTFKLQAVLTTMTASVGTGHFDANDSLTGSDQNCTATIFAINGVALNGVSTSATSYRKLWFCFTPPTSTSLTGQQLVTVTLSGLAG